MTQWIDLLRKLSTTPGPPGFEDDVRELIKGELEGEVDQLFSDAFGNLYAFKRGAMDRVLMIAAHMDEVALMVRYIEQNGFLRVTNIGGLNPTQLLSQRVLVHGRKTLRGVIGALPVHLGKEEPPKMEDLYVDIGARDKDHVAELGIRPGNPVTFDVPFYHQDETGIIVGKALDDRLGCLVLMEALKKAAPKYALYGVFTAQEERGMSYGCMV